MKRLARAFKWWHTSVEHPYWRAYPGFPQSHWGPLWGEWWCTLLDSRWLFRGWMHD